VGGQHSVREARVRFQRAVLYPEVTANWAGDFGSGLGFYRGGRVVFWLLRG
jgi:hypothetical protein